MMRHKFRSIWLFILLTTCLMGRLPVFAQEAEPAEPVVQAVLFYSPTCPHCHEVITNFLIPLLDEYGPQLEVLGIDTSTESGSYLYNAAVTAYQIPQNRMGVPTLIVADTVLVGGYEVPELFPGILEAGLKAGGIGWPEIPGLAEIVVDLSPSAVPTQSEAEPLPTVTTATDGVVTSAETAETAVATHTPILTATATPEAPVLPLSEIDSAQIDSETTQNPPADPAGFALGWFVLLGLVVVMLFAVWKIIRNWPYRATAGDTQAGPTQWPTWWGSVMWLLVLLGLGVSGYLAYVEVTHVTAVCGPIGECNIVQSSPYATLLGIPVALFGMLFYLAVGVLLWVMTSGGTWQDTAVWALVGLTAVGVLFSIYLTWLELMVIRAICAWCLTSAVVTGLMLLLTTWPLGKRPLVLTIK